MGEIKRPRRAALESTHNKNATKSSPTMRHRKCQHRFRLVFAPLAQRRMRSHFLKDEGGGNRRTTSPIYVPQCERLAEMKFKERRCGKRCAGVLLSTRPNSAAEVRRFRSCDCAMHTRRWHLLAAHASVPCSELRVDRKFVQFIYSFSS